jgi:hypothetical protein
MQEVLIIDKVEFEALMQQVATLAKRVARLERSLVQWIGTVEASLLTGLHRDTLYSLRKAGKVECRYEGVKVLYLRSSLEEYIESTRPRKKSLIPQI